ncbi:hypothetical protein [Lentzea sp. NPDC051838]|uniref:hypothetical protein n=1 Tax=Lentzea sp. NPDC051838 TaxID=3154849 RepID=UPI003419AA45
MRRRWFAVGAVVLLAAASAPFILRDEPIVPAGAVRARMYVDWHAVRDWPADAAVDRDLAGVVSALNALPSTKLGEGCLAMLRPGYRMRFEYADGSDHTVVFDLNCGSVRRGDIARYGEITKVLDVFAERYRAQGGVVPDPPWQW